MTKYLITFLIALCSLANAQSVHYENQVIEKIDVIIENSPEDPNSILTRLKTRQGDIFSHLDFDNDLKTLAGEFDRVIPQFQSLNGKMYITLRIWPKPTIRTLEYLGNSRILSDRLEKELGVPPGSLFDRQAFNKAFHKLKAYYVKKGFFEAELDYTVNLDATCNAVDIIVSIKEGRAGRIKKIAFWGFTHHEESELLDILATKEYNLFTSWMTNQGTYNEEMIAHDQLSILNYIQNAGFADAKISIDVEEVHKSERIIVNINLDRGGLYQFGEITFDGNKLYTDDQIRARLGIACGDPYSTDDLRAAISSVTDFYGRRGYIDAVVDFEPSLDCENNLYKVHFSIDEGQQFNVGLIKIFGNTCTQNRVILHETILTPGETFNIEKLQSTEERLHNIGFFKNVNVYAVKSDDESGLGGSYRDVHIEVEEMTTGHFSTQFGISNNEALFGGVSLTEKNFNYQGLRSCWREGFCNLRGGGEYVHANATWGTKSTKYELGWAKPYFNDTQWTVGFDIDKSSTRYISEDYTIDGTGIMLHASYQNNAFVRTALHYRLRNTHIDIRSFHHTKKKCEKFFKEAKNHKEKAEAHHLCEQQLHDYHKLKERAKHAGIVSAWGATWYYDSTDHPVLPHKGFRSRLMGEVAGIGGRHSFIGLGYINTYYYPLHRRGTLKFRFDLRFIVPYGGETKPQSVPLDEKLFLGGDNNIRGYRSYRLGPQAGRDDPLGGTSLQYYSIEYERKLITRAQLFFFFDAGSLNDRVLSFGRIYMSAGYGLRIKIHDRLPAFTLGLGYPINPKSRSEVKKFFFQMGGQF